MLSKSQSLKFDPLELTIEELISVQPRYLRGKLASGRHEPEGERPGRRRAQTLDFDSLGPYEPGDDVRNIDWRATMRFGETTVRRFKSASHRKRMLVLDLKPSLYFATDERLMAKTACLTSAWLAWASQLLNEPVGMHVGEVLIAPQRGRRHILRLLDLILQEFQKGANDTSSAKFALDSLATVTSHEDEICVIGEIPDHIENLVRGGRALSAIRNLRYFVVEDPMILSPVKPGRYPILTQDGKREVLDVRVPEKPFPSTTQVLRDAGWQLEKARDLLPSGGEA